MKYYVIEIADGDEKIKGKGIYEYDSKNKALASYHKKLGTAMDSDLYTKEQIFVVDEFNNVLEQEYFTKSVAEQPTEETAE
ncbi:MAG: hypothetical protein KBT03_06245 [Bacteroidales bacterium]|nr:hypothetical protein [Candidatus Scybalousia scybalohippi]